MKKMIISKEVGYLRVAYCVNSISNILEKEAVSLYLCM